MSSNASPEPAHPFAAMIGEVEARAFMLIFSAVASAIALVSIAYAIYAGLKTWLPPAGAAAITSAVFAALTIGVGLVGRAAIEKKAREAKARAEAARLAHPPSLAKAAGALALTALGRVGEAVVRHRLAGR